MWKAFLVCLIACFGLSSCIKAPDYPIEPHIEFKSVSAEFVKVGTNGIGGPENPVDTIIFSFTDGDGDIGVESNVLDTNLTCKLKTGDSSQLRSRAFNVFLIDSRDSCITTFASANVEPSGKYKGISGEIVVIQRVPSTKCIQPTIDCPDDTVIYYMVIRDKAGHLSNIVPTPPIIINSKL